MRRVLVAAKMVTMCVAMAVATGCSLQCHKPPVEPPKAEVKAPIDDRAKEGTKMVDEKDMPKVFFDFDKYEIRADQQARVDKSVDYLKGHADVKVRIEGNCDERGTIEYNLGLGEKRAKTISEYLTGHGIAKDRVTILSRGKENPADMGKTDESYAKNRRDEYFYTAGAPAGAK